MRDPETNTANAAAASPDAAQHARKPAAQGSRESTTTTGAHPNPAAEPALYREKGRHIEGWRAETLPSVPPERLGSTPHSKAAAGSSTSLEQPKPQEILSTTVDMMPPIAAGASIPTRRSKLRGCIHRGGQARCRSTTRTSETGEWRVKNYFCKTKPLSKAAVSAQILWDRSNRADGTLVWGPRNCEQPAAAV